MDVHEPFEKEADVEPQEDMPVAVSIDRTPLSNLTRRCCCVGGLLFWIVLFITPCVCFVPLFVNSEVTLSYGGRPGQEVRLFRVSEDEARGLGLSWGNVDIENDDDSYCVQTEVRYLVWEGEATNVAFCQCYIQIAGDEWDVAASFEDSCDSIGQWQPGNSLSD